MHLFPYQEEGAKFLAGKPHALLADEMGLGKSAQVVRACDHVGAVNVLVVCPASVRINWTREFARFSPFDHTCTVLVKRSERPRAGVNVISYDLLTDDKLRQAMKAVAWDVLVLDEAHYLKERSTKRTKAVYGHAQFAGIAASARRVWRLSGTPAPNGLPSELYAHLKSAGIVRQPYWDFVFEHSTGFQGDYGYKETGVKDPAKIRNLLSQFMLRRKKDDPTVNLQLPEIFFQHVTVDRSDVELDPWFYENWRPLGEGMAGQQRFLADLKDVDSTLKKALATIKQGHHHNEHDSIRLLESFAKSTATLRRYIGLAKVQRVCDILEEELESKSVDKLVVFCVHAQVIEAVRERLKRFKCVQLYGNTPQAKRQHNIDKFQTDPRCRVFIGQIVAAGTGITLTAAHEVAFVEADWVPANNAQAAMRCHRVGQTHKVRVRFFNCAGSVDEDVMRVVLNKTREIAKFMD